jgi:hypothetical protein
MVTLDNPKVFFEVLVTLMFCTSREGSGIQYFGHAAPVRIDATSMMAENGEVLEEQ